MNSATKLIYWYWSEYGPKLDQEKFSVLLETNYTDCNKALVEAVGEYDGPCQCGTEKIIEGSSNPDQMRSFMMIGVLIDQMMWSHHAEMYSSFRSVFRYPKLYLHAHYIGMASPSWFAYSHHGFDKKVNWSVVADVAQILLSDLYQWFNREGSIEELARFQKLLKREVSLAFESVTAERLAPIIDRINGINLPE